MENKGSSSLLVMKVRRMALIDSCDEEYLDFLANPGKPLHFFYLASIPPQLSTADFMCIRIVILSTQHTIAGSVGLQDPHTRESDKELVDQTTRGFTTFENASWLHVTSGIRTELVRIGFKLIRSPRGGRQVRSSVEWGGHRKRVAETRRAKPR